MRTVLGQIVGLFNAYQNCIKSGNEEWEQKHLEAIENLCENRLPHGSGFDGGTELDLDASSDDCLVFNTSFHHMDEWGSYCGWTDHTVKVSASLHLGFDLDATGEDEFNNGILDYIAETFALMLSMPLSEDVYSDCNVKSDCRLFTAACALLKKQTGFGELRAVIENR